MDPTLGEVVAGGHLNWLHALGRRAGLRRAWADWFDAYDLLLCPVIPVEAFPHNQEGEFIDRTIDWRQSPVRHAHRGWKRVEIPAALQANIFGFMSDVGQHFARIDFLRKDDCYTFLEANYNGEWGWLDPDATEGLMAKIVHEIDPETPCASCPRPRW